MTQHPSTTVTENRKFTITDFLHDSRAIGILLLLCTATSLILTNLPGIGENYSQFWETEIPFLHSAHLPHSILHVINDFLMALFFFQVGMEIKRETVVGELSSPSRMMMPMIAALFGVIFPAIIFLTATKGTVYQSGWAIPTATDIAFSLGILSLLGKAVPHSIKIFLTALAIIDDLCAILIIAFFYGGQPKFTWLLGVAASILIIILVIKYLKSPFSRILYLSLGMVMWYCMYQSGIHATFAGVILSALLPIKKIPVYEKISYSCQLLIIPIFALANTSIAINASAIANLTGELSIGIVLGLLIGKPVGISLGVYLMTKCGLSGLNPNPTGCSCWSGNTCRHRFYDVHSFQHLHSKTEPSGYCQTCVLIASTLSMIIGYAWLKIALKKRQVEL